MLIISRKPGESFYIGDNIEVVILDVQNDRIKVGIQAPDTIKIVRRELREIEKANRDSAGSTENMQLNDICRAFAAFPKKQV